jgi:hypothetical protein
MEKLLSNFCCRAGIIPHIFMIWIDGTLSQNRGDVKVLNLRIPALNV